MSSIRSIVRARKHIDDLKSAIDEFNRSGKAYSLVTKAFKDHKRYVVKAKLNNSIPDEFECIATDAIYNLRASLDQAVYTAAEFAKGKGGGGIDLTKIHWMFPIKSTQSQVKSSVEKICCADGFPDEIGDMILSFEPYKKESEESLLYALNRAANINKHKFLTQTNLRLGNFRFEHISGPKTIAGSKYINIPNYHPA